MLNLGRLKWIMDADDSRFNRKMGKAERRIRTLKRTAVAAVAGMGGGAAAGKALGGYDELAKTSRGTGIGVQSLQEIYFAGGRAGIGREEMRGNLERYTRRLGLLKKGRGALAEHLKKADPGLMKRLKGAGAEQGLGMLADASAALDPEERVALMQMAGMGGGLKAVSLFGGGKRGYRNLRKMGRGTMFSATEAEARSAERTTDVWGDVGTAVGSGASKVLNYTMSHGLGGAMTDGADTLLSVLREIRDQGSTNGAGGSVGP